MIWVPKINSFSFVKDEDQPAVFKTMTGITDNQKDNITVSQMDVSINEKKMLYVYVIGMYVEDEFVKKYKLMCWYQQLFYEVLVGTG